MKAIETIKGSFILYKGQPHLIVERDVYSPGKGAGLLHLKLKNMKTGAFFKVVLKTIDEVEEVELEYKEVKYLYSHRSDFCFIEEPNNRIMLSADIVGDNKYFFKANDIYTIVIYENEPISLKIPIKVTLTVVDAEDSVKGNTATGDTKEVGLETGLRIRVPSFIKKGDKVVVNTESKEYSERG
jgi:elongation factor P